MLERKGQALLLTSMCLLSIGAAMTGNAFFSGQSSIDSTGGFQSIGGSPSHSSYYAFLKPSDRLTATLQTNSSSGMFSLLIHKVQGDLVLNRTSTGGLSAIFTPSQRGTYFLNASFVPPDSKAYENSITITIIGGQPDDYLGPGLALLSAGVVLSMAWFLSRFRVSPKPDVREDVSPPPPLVKGTGGKGLLYLVTHELGGGRKLFFSVPVLFVVFYSAGSYFADLINLPQSVANPNLADLFSPSLNPYNDWLNVFPIVVALATYSFAYERENKVLRTTFLNPIGSGRLFFAKLCSMIISVEVPIVVGMVVTLLLFDPTLAVAAPLAVFGNAPYWLTLYILYASVMIGIAVLPAVLFKKAIYSFIVPLFIVFAISTEGFGLRDFVPWQVWSVMGTGPLSTSAGFENAFDMGSFLIAALPALAISVGFILLSWLVFMRQDKE